jgi:hypothetical protein
MKKETLVAQLEAAKALTSVVSIDNVIALIQQLEAEVQVVKYFKLTRELADEIANRIERRLDNDSHNLVDIDSAEFSLGYDNKIELESVELYTDNIMTLVTDSIEEFVCELRYEEEEPEDEAEINEIDEDATAPWVFPRSEE